MQVLLDGLRFGESVRWHDGKAWVCDWATGQVLSVGSDGETTVVATVASYPLCIDWSTDGKLLLVAGGDEKLLRLEPDGSLAVQADLAGYSTGPWNEVAVDGHGNVFVNGGEGVIVAVDPAGAVRQVATGLEWPNGMAVSSDGSTLVVAESHASRLTAFTIGPRGVLSGRRVWATIPGSAPDGICFDADSCIWYADVPNRHCQRVAEDGTVLATIEVDRGCFSCAVGGPSGQTLFIAATEWRGFDRMFEGPPTGQLLADVIV